MDINTKINWAQMSGLNSREYNCGHCGKAVASNLGFFASDYSNTKYSQIYICHFCTRPTFFDIDGQQTPGKLYGNDVSNIDDELVSKLYNEARNATSANSFTAAVLCCRKLLMHIAVSKGAKEGESFAFYVQYLSDNHFVPPGAQIWVDHIRTKGNEANHEITIMTSEEAKELIDFSEMLLKIIYEFPANVHKRYSKPIEENVKKVTE